MAGVSSMVGRAAELKALTLGIDEIRQGRGGVWFVTGEPGIGKTRLLEEVSERARAAGASVFWGRCWEAGGAPAFWPWIEVLRALLRCGAGTSAHQAVVLRARVLSQLLPELGEPHGLEALAQLGGERGRFELLETLARALCDAARDVPLVCVLEDLHAADEATVSVLELLNQQARSSRLAVIATMRDADARLALGARVLARLARGPRCLALSRLSETEVGEFLAQASGGAFPNPAACAAVHRITEGNPLFLVEVSRLSSERGGWHSAEQLGMTVPRSVRHAIRARLERLSPGARAALDVASVIGREFRAQPLAELAGRALAELDAALGEALDAGLLLELAPGEYRFSHVLLREVLHLDLDPARRAALHRHAAEALRRRSEPDAAWSEIAHHLLEAGPEARDAALDACSRAAADSFAKLAFADAVDGYARALAVLGPDPSSDVTRRGPLLLALAEAQFHAADVAAGQATCRRALELARTLGDGELLARAALAYGTVLNYAVVDPTLVALLREALLALPPGPSATRAIVMARLAAAEQPAPEPARYFELAREAIAMARDVGDPGTLLSTLRYAISALMDLGPPSERLALNREYVQLAQVRREPVEALRGTMRSAFDQLELGDFAALEASIEAVEQRTRSLGHPFFAWRAQSFRALSAIFAGELAYAEEHLELAARLGREGRDPSANIALAFQRHMIARISGDDEAVLAAMPRLAQLFDGSELGRLSVRAMTAEALVRAGRREQAAAHIEPGELLRLIGYGDLSTFAPIANVVLALALPDVAEAALAGLAAVPRAFASGGMMTMCAGEPVAYIRATLERTVGRHADAERGYELALQQARQAGALPFAAWIELDRASLLWEVHAAARAEEVRASCRRVLEAASRLNAEGLARRARALLAEAATSAPSVAPVPDATRPPAAEPDRSEPAVAIERDGESWLVSWGPARLRLKESKGLEWLARLVNEPGREFHVLDLAGAPEAVDGGDGGELLDARAREEYRERLRNLETELADAEQDADAGRVTARREELEFLRAELSRALGLGGRGRRAGAASERARVNVQRRLRSALDRITLQHPALGQKLERALKTGLYCSYRP